MKVWRGACSSAGSIGYVEYAYAKQNNLTYTKLINKAGKTLEPSIETFQAARRQRGLGWRLKPGITMFWLINPAPMPGRSAGATWVIVYKNPPDKAATASALKFFKWAYENGDAAAKSLDYVALPPNAVKAIETSWKSIQGSGM